MKRVALRKALLVTIAVLAVTIATIAMVANTAWFADRIRNEVIGRLTTASGGGVEIRSFRFDWRTLRVDLEGVAIHGREPAGTEPLAVIDHVVVHLRIVSFLRRDIDVTGIEASRPRIHFMVGADGTTNLPVRPQTKSGTQDLLALKVDSLVASDGLLVAEIAGRPRQMIPWNLRAEKLGLHLTWNASLKGYAASLSAEPLHLEPEGLNPISVNVQAEATLEPNLLRISRAHLAGAKSEVVFTDLRITDILHLEMSGHVGGSIALADLARTLKSKLYAAGNVAISGELDLTAAGYRIAGDVKGSGLSLAGFTNLETSAKILASPGKIAAQGIRLRMGGGVFSGNGEVHELRNFRISGNATGVSARVLARALGTQTPPWDGLVAGSVAAAGTLGAPLREASAHLTVTPASAGPAIHGEIAANWNGPARRLDLGHSWIALPDSRVEVSGVVGDRLEVKAETSNPEDFRPLLQQYLVPFSLRDGTATFAGTVVGAMNSPQISGHVELSHALVHGQEVDAAQGDVIASANQVKVTNGSATAQGMEIRGTITAGLTNWNSLPTSAIEGALELVNADVVRLVKLVDYKGIQVTGTVRGSARIAGTVADPRAEADVTVSRGTIAEQPFDSITGHLQYLGPGAQAVTGLFVSGPKRVNLTARRSGGNAPFPQGRTAFEISSNSMALNEIALVRARQPDIGGAAEFHATGTLDVGQEWHLATLDASGAATAISLNGRDLGNARFSVKGQNDVVEARVDSDVAGATVHGEGSVTLQRDLPATAVLTVADGDVNALAVLLAAPGTVRRTGITGTLRGRIVLQGPLRRPEQISATLDIPKLELRPARGSPLLESIPGFAVRSLAPIHASLTRSILHLDPVRFGAPETDVTVDGSVDMSGQFPLNLRVRGAVNMAMARSFVPDLTASGALVLDTVVRGNAGAPLFSGRAAIRAGDFHYAGFSNGLTNVVGEVVFNGPRATIQTLRGETGGGKVDASGFAALNGDVLVFRMDASAVGVRVRYPEGVSSISDANITVAGSSGRSEASGVVTIHRLAISPRADLAGMIASAAQPPPGLSNTGLMANMNLDIQVETAPDLAFETNVAQSIQADASLRLRGTAASPALLGRVNITHGELVFFGNKYTISQGSVAFFNPARIEPVLNLDLTTRARGVDVVLTVAGPADRLNMSYRSDPPLEFSDIISLLATGRAPTSQTGGSLSTGPASGFEQLGAGALLGQALANPVAGRLQRFFGVSRLKIDPQLTGLSGSPQARLTIEQQITPDILFTYITDVARTNNQLIRVEWALSRQVSAILVREENGYVGIDFAWKKRFK